MDHTPTCKKQNYKSPRNTIGENLNDLGYGDGLLDRTPKLPSMQEKTDKLDFVKMKASILGKTLSRQ